MIWIRTEENGPFQNNWYSTNMVWMVQNHFGLIEGQGIRSLVDNQTVINNNGLIKVYQKMAIFEFDLENEVSGCVKNRKLKTWGLKPRFENPETWLVSNKAMIN
jgi:hypothetical protein